MMADVTYTLTCTAQLTLDQVRLLCTDGADATVDIEFGSWDENDWQTVKGTITDITVNIPKGKTSG